MIQIPLAEIHEKMPLHPSGEGVERRCRGEHGHDCAFYEGTERAFRIRNAELCEQVVERNADAPEFFMTEHASMLFFPRAPAHDVYREVAYWEQDMPHGAFQNFCDQAFLLARVKNVPDKHVSKIEKCQGPLGSLEGAEQEVGSRGKRT